MKSFFQTMQLIEAQASDSALFNYLRTIKENPNLEDLNTFFGMLQKSYQGEDKTGYLADMLPSIEMIINKLPSEEQPQAKLMLARFNVHPNTNYYLKIKGHGKFSDVQEFEDFILTAMQKGHLSALYKTIKDPANKYWWEMASDAVKEELKRVAEEEERRMKNQPSIGKSIADAIRKAIQDGPQDADSSGTV